MLYRIKMEVLDPENGHPFLESESSEVVECDGFVLMLTQGGNKGKVIIHDINTMDMANLIAGHDDVLRASIIAKALRDAHGIQFTREDK